jgi:DNA-binding CsgD family transcriptional regulator
MPQLRGEPPPDLTPRESEVMRLSEEGMTTDAIEHELGITHRTLRGHLAAAFRKLAPGRGRSGAFYELGKREKK